MTNKEWNHLCGKSKYCTRCLYPGGEDCTARDGERCVALRDTHLVNGKCVFYRSKSAMSQEELDAYNEIAFPEKESSES